ncbi:Uncharacterized protein PCOAH_00048110 [Plasmodium coatneyi]|uniref:Uncharacterized protein n=1 Tax=Plasmodium coatneyi TaxID=208452 RepID=A0A1B1E755_9APIC|nr:Uncharacterized protein PCOAH_00048110 [Plasmodium coatneyi]ANQ10770.1 Uncharacterized protein PCOAH_00048110 [Plasmodium coatneyi]
MAYSMGSPYSPYSMVGMDKPFSSLGENYYVSEPYSRPPTPVIGNMFHGSFPSYYADDADDDDDYDDGDYYFFCNGEEDFLTEESYLGQNPIPDENKTEEVENKTGEVENKTGDVENKTEEAENKTGEAENKTGNLVRRNNKLNFYQAAMVIVILMRWARNNSTRLVRKHEARMKLLRYLDKMNERIKKDDLKMEKKRKKMEAKIKKEEEDMEVKWKEKRAAIRHKIAKNPSKDTLPGIGPFYDRDKSLLEKKLDIIDLNYQKDKYNKKKRWKAMREAHRKEVNKLQKIQDERKMRKCVRMFWFEKRWNFGPTTVRAYLKPKHKKVDEDKMLDKLKEIREIEERKSMIEEKKAEVARAIEAARMAEEEKKAEAARRIEAAKAAEAARIARVEKIAGLVEAADRAETARAALGAAATKATTSASEKKTTEEDDDDDVYFYYVNSDDGYNDDDDFDDYYDDYASMHGYYDQDDDYS